jgi:phosphoribosylanthranilate isomerase
VTVRVKICGVTNVADAHLAVQCGADLVGLNFYPLSPRYVSFSVAREIRAVIPPEVWCVGVFVNAERRHILNCVEQLKLHAVQFHGDEEGDMLQGWPCITIKALRVPATGPLPNCAQVSTDYVLLDTFRAGRYGGTGTVLPWESVASLPVGQLGRLILAGGLTAENVVPAVRMIRPWAVDVASGVESRPGQKDQEKLRAFIYNAKTA